MRVLLPLLAMLAAATPALAQAQAGGPDHGPDGIVTAQATIHRAAPNTVVVATLGIELHGRDIQSVLGPLGTASHALLDRLKAHGASDVATGEASVQPETEAVKNAPDRIVGYFGRESVSFRSTPDAFPALAADALANGANTLAGFALAPSDEDLAKARRAAVLAATAAALDEARAIAAAAGAHPVGAPDITVGDGFIPRPTPRFAAMAMASPAPPPAIAAGSSEISVTVEARLRVAPGAP